MIEGLSINAATVKPLSLTQLVAACERHGIRAIAPWRDQIRSHGLAESGRLIRDAGLQVTGVCRGGVFTAPTAEGRRAAIDDNRRAIEEAAAVNADCLVMIAGGLPQGSRDLAGAREVATEGLAAILPEARAAKVPLALEPLHPMTAPDRCCWNTLSQVLDLCDRFGEGTGVAVDVYHVWWDSDLPKQIARAGKRILGHHICDWLVPTRDTAFDRGMMGDGVIDLSAIRRMVEAAGYHGPQEVEIFSAENWWKRDADEVLKICVERYNTICRTPSKS